MSTSALGRANGRPRDLVSNAVEPAVCDSLSLGWLGAMRRRTPGSEPHHAPHESTWPAP